MLGVCGPDLRYIYVLPGWEGSAGDSRVLRDALRRQNCLQVPNGNIMKMVILYLFSA